MEVGRRWVRALERYWRVEKGSVRDDQVLGVLRMGGHGAVAKLQELEVIKGNLVWGAEYLHGAEVDDARSKVVI